MPQALHLTRAGNVLQFLRCAPKFPVSAALLEGMRSNAEMLKAHLENRRTARQVIEAAVMSLIEWIVTNPEWARYIYTVSSSRLMQQGATQLNEVNSQNSELLNDYLAKHWKQLRSVPTELLPSLLLGSVHDYARRWLNGQVLTNPKELENFFIDAAWQNVKSH